MRLAERPYQEAARLARDPRSVVILPLGAVEQHGPHLPLLVDWLGAEALAQTVAPHLERAGYRVILAPALPYGASPLAARWPGTVSLTPGTLRRVIVEIVAGLAGHGFRRFVLANYQADPAHVRTMGEAKRALLRKRAAGGGRREIQFAGFSPEASTRAPAPSPRAPGEAERSDPAGPGAGSRGSDFPTPGVRRHGAWLDAVWNSQKPGIRLPRHHPPRRSQITRSSSWV